MTFLFDSWEHFIGTYDEVSKQQPAWLDPTLPKQEKIEDPRLADFGKLIKEQHLSVSAAAVKVGVSTTTGVRWAKVLGIKFVSRSQILKPVFLDSVRALLKSGAKKEEIRQRTGISAVSLDRLISSEPNLRLTWVNARMELDRARNREKFLSVTAANTGVPFNRIRRIAGNGYQWLYRHDRQWLVEHLPAIWRDSK